MELMMAKEHLYTLIKVATEEDIRAQIGTTTHFDLVNYDSIKVHRVKKQTPFQDFKAQIAEELGIPVVLQRYWVWAKRINKTTRPNRPLTAVEEAQTVQQLKDSHMKMPLTELRLFLEAPILREDLKQLSPSLPERNRGDILIFFKLYDPEKETLQYVGSLYVRLSYRPNEVMRHINRLAGFPEDQPIKLFEEIKFDPNVMCEAIDKKLTLKGSQLEDGDIICFQKELPLGAASAHRFPEVPAFMENVVNRQVVHFRKLEKPSAPYFDLELSKELTYLDAISALAAHMGLDNPAKLRLSPHNVHTHMPRVAPFKYATSDKLYDMLRGNTPYSDILYYEVLDIPLPDLEKLKTLNVVFANSKVEEVASHQIRIPRTGTVSDLLVELRKKVELSRPDAELRVVEVITSKISKVLPPGDKISDQCWKIRAEEVPTEEVDAGPNDRLLHVYHFRRDKLNKDQAILFGNPFLLVVREGETMAEVKARIKAKLGTKDGEFDTWKFAHVTNKASPEYIKDDEVVLTRFPSVVSIFEAEFLGMEHADMGPQRARIREPERRGHETDTDPDPESKPNHEPDAEAGLKPDHKLGSDSDGGSAGKPWLTANPGIVNGAWLDELRVFWESNSGLQSVPVIPDEKSRELLQRFLSDKRGQLRLARTHIKSLGCGELRRRCAALRLRGWRIGWRTPLLWGLHLDERGSCRCCGQVAGITMCRLPQKSACGGRI
ncbi:putative ubiquitin carboxyl-terminal hydrolase [Klebsormidium nitens]|uniref:ubiquitinyl hydrolase 1 n=1 Tax=Klebsormidium nitens TaxID=105231 RepID=A0A1Y1HQJ6_KLENI|nr:putative ubiquitin carboxyl-terminal hydrolase [Klebsormidium nitens]|eukprot:GAQ80905.1 putative ubiquitin carboxyl-terminal hydrolase [Klebsormidium nitens]